jgi:hypothetical membrane protein
MNKLKLSGLLLFLAGSFALIGYTTFHSEISDLGATKPPNSLIYQPSTSIFNVTMLCLPKMLLFLLSVWVKQKDGLFTRLCYG